MTKAAYCVRAYGGKYAKSFKRGGYAAIGWDVEDLSGISRGDNAALGAAYDSAYPEDGRARRGQGIGQIRSFMWDIKLDRCTR
ncbi:MAG: hypothetical protein M3434_01925 [Gemmatimonadota bacterium]|jgi:hypothetical protein|nr:hypothetical protein [Gemmatimonadota bacterium]